MDGKKNPWFEMYGVNLMLFSPTEVGRTWTAGDDRGLWHAELEPLGLSSEAKNAAKTRMENLVQFRAQAKIVANALKSNAYGGSEPHPTRSEARSIMQQLQALDAAFEENDRGLDAISDMASELAAKVARSEVGLVEKIAAAAKALKRPKVAELKLY